MTIADSAKAARSIALARVSRAPKRLFSGGPQANAASLSPAPGPRILH